MIVNSERVGYPPVDSEAQWTLDTRAHVASAAATREII